MYMSSANQSTNANYPSIRPWQLNNSTTKRKKEKRGKKRALISKITFFSVVFNGSKNKSERGWGIGDGDGIVVVCLSFYWVSAQFALAHARTHALTHSLGRCSRSYQHGPRYFHTNSTQPLVSLCLSPHNRAQKKTKKKRQSMQEGLRRSTYCFFLFPLVTDPCNCTI